LFFHSEPVVLRVADIQMAKKRAKPRDDNDDGRTSCSVKAWP